MEFVFSKKTQIFARDLITRMRTLERGLPDLQIKLLRTPGTAYNFLMPLIGLKTENIVRNPTCACGFIE